MNWLRRNLFIVVGVLVAAGVMTLAVMYLLSRYSRSEQYSGEFNDMVAKIQEYINKDPYPMEENIVVYQDSTKVIRKFMSGTVALLNPLAYEKMDTQKFKTHLENTIADLSREATNFSVALPSKYAFTFADIRPKPNLVPYGVEPLTMQLAEIHLLCSSLFQARIHSLESLQRVRVSSDDGTSATDYLDDRRIITNSFSITTPYKVGFRCFQSELSAVLNSLATSKDFVVVKTMTVESTGDSASAGGDVVKPPDNPPPPPPPAGNPPPGKKGQPLIPGKSVFPVVLDAKPIRVTMLIEVVRPLKKASK
jgi:hypothetical protein